MSGTTIAAKDSGSEDSGSEDFETNPNSKQKRACVKVDIKFGIHMAIEMLLFYLVRQFI